MTDFDDPEWDREDLLPPRPVGIELPPQRCRLVREDHFQDSAGEEWTVWTYEPTQPYCGATVTI